VLPGKETILPRLESKAKHFQALLAWLSASNDEMESLTQAPLTLGSVVTFEAKNQSNIWAIFRAGEILMALIITFYQ
jgi:hypothetical protein